MRRFTARLDLAALPPLLVLALHLALVLHFEHPAAILSGRPIALVDYETHYEQVLRAVEAFERSGRMWAWDPHLLAGSIAGAIFDADNKLHELWVVALHRLGVPTPVAFNLFVVAAHLAVAPAAWAAARAMRLGRAGATAAALLTSCIWFFDGTSHWAFWAGMISWGAAAALAPLPIALFHRWCEAPRGRWLAATVALLAVLHQLHPYVFFVLAPPMLADFARARRHLHRREQLAAVLGALVVVGANLWWLGVAARFWHYVLRSDYFLAATWDQLVSDWMEIRRDALGPITPQTSFRFFAYGLALGGLVEMARRRDARLLPLGTALGVTVGCAYLGGHLAPLRHLQPYRFAIASAYLAALPAGILVDALARAPRGTLRGLPAALAVALGLVAVPSLAQDVAFRLPELVRGVPGLRDYAIHSLRPAYDWRGETRPLPLAERVHVPAPPESRALEDFVREHDDGTRWLVESWLIGERLAWATDAEVLGGFRELNLAHSDANFFRRYPDGDAPDGELAAYLERYDVGWVIVSNLLPAVESRDDLLESVGSVLQQRVYRVRHRSGRVVGGGPGEARAELDRIVARGTSGGRVVLRYHWLETFACRPGCRVVRVPVEHDRVGFVGVEDAPADFEIVNAGFAGR